MEFLQSDGQVLYTEEYNEPLSPQQTTSFFVPLPELFEDLTVQVRAEDESGVLLQDTVEAVMITSEEENEPAVTFTVTVNNGTGSGDYIEGASVTIAANDPESGKQFAGWTGADSLTFTDGDATTAKATFTMPPETVTVTATYEDVSTALANGVCGDNLTWVLDEACRLTICGTGEMYDYESYDDVGNRPWEEYRDQIVEVIITDGVTSIGEMAFDTCKAIESVSLPESLTEISYCAFWGCESLISITIPENVTTIGDYTFSHCSSIDSIAIPESVSFIGTEAFWGCESLTSISIPGNVTAIGDYTFSHCTGLKSISLPETVVSIGVGAFWGCENLVDINLPSGLTSISEELFYHCDNLTSIIIPTGVTSIGDYAFQFCGNLGNVKFPDALESIGYAAFGDCYNITEILIPNTVSTIGEWAFGECDGLSFVVLPDQVATIGECAFYSCDNLKNVVLPNGITQINEWVFGHCVNLSEISIPDSVIRICSLAFYNCTSLTDINYGGTSNQWSEMVIGEENESLNYAVVHINSSTRTGSLGNAGELMWIYSDGSDSVTVFGPVSNFEPVLIASYDVDGKMITVEMLTESGDSVGFSHFSNAIKIFWLNSNHVPKCENGTINL